MREGTDLFALVAEVLAELLEEDLADLRVLLSDGALHLPELLSDLLALLAREVRIGHAARELLALDDQVLQVLGMLPVAVAHPRGVECLEEVQPALRLLRLVLAEAREAVRHLRVLLGILRPHPLHPVTRSAAPLLACHRDGLAALRRRRGLGFGTATAALAAIGAVPAGRTERHPDLPLHGLLHDLLDLDRLRLGDGPDRITGASADDHSHDQRGKGDGQVFLVELHLPSSVCATAQARPCVPLTTPRLKKNSSRGSNPGLLWMST